MIAREIAREIARNGGLDNYRAVEAYVRARLPKTSTLSMRPILRETVTAKLHEQWSPQQISVWLRREYPDDPQMRVSHGTIYRCLYIPPRKSFDSNAFHELRTERTIHRYRGKKRSHGRGRIRNMVSIEHRTPAANDRSEPGHLEGDLVFGTRPSAVVTAVDRHTRVTHVVALPDRYRSESVADALIAYLALLPDICVVR